MRKAIATGVLVLLVLPASAWAQGRAATAYDYCRTRGGSYDVCRDIETRVARDTGERVTLRVRAWETRTEVTPPPTFMSALVGSVGPALSGWTVARFGYGDTESIVVRGNVIYGVPPGLGTTTIYAASGIRIARVFCAGGICTVHK
jgi:hypothetical protein